MNTAKKSHLAGKQQASTPTIYDQQPPTTSLFSCFPRNLVSTTGFVHCSKKVEGAGGREAAETKEPPTTYVQQSADKQNGRSGVRSETQNTKQRSGPKRLGSATLSAIATPTNDTDKRQTTRNIGPFPAPPYRRVVLDCS